MDDEGDEGGEDGEDFESSDFEAGGLGDAHTVCTKVVKFGSGKISRSSLRFSVNFNGYRF